MLPKEQTSSPHFLGFVLILAFAAVLGWFTVRESLLPLSGIRGVAAEVSPAHAAIVLESAKVLGDGRFSFDGINRFTVLWNEETLFFAYADRSAIKAGSALPVATDNLQAGQKLVIMPREKAGNVITALEVRILPD